MNTTVRIKASDIYKDWHVIDGAGRALGRVASEAAILLRGKHKPTYEPHLDDGDFVIVVNAAQVKVTGRKSEQKKYHRHSGYPGGLKTRSYAEQMARYPERVVEKAVWGMLPGGSLGEAMFKHLKVYRGPNHPHQSQMTGSQRAQAQRAEATAALAEQPRKVARLRPLGVPAAVAEALAAEAAAALVAAEVPAPAVPAETEVKPRSTRKVAAEAVSPEAAPAEVAAKPRRTRKIAAEAASPQATSVLEAAPAVKPRARRKAVETVEAAAEATPEAVTEAKKPVRRRAAKTEE
jgi:large subunit ribosomal protein L13